MVQVVAVAVRGQVGPARRKVREARQPALVVVREGPRRRIRERDRLVLPRQCVPVLEVARDRAPDDRVQASVRVVRVRRRGPALDPIVRHAVVGVVLIRNGAAIALSHAREPVGGVVAQDGRVCRGQRLRVDDLRQLLPLVGIDVGPGVGAGYPFERVVRVRRELVLSIRLLRQRVVGVVGVPVSLRRFRRQSPHSRADPRGRRCTRSRCCWRPGSRTGGPSCTCTRWC